MKSVDAEKIQAEVAKAMKEVDAAKIKADIDAEMAKIDWNKIQKEMEKVKTEDMAKIQENLKKMKPEIEKSMNKAHEDIDRAKKELTAYKTLIDGLDRDGLINKKEPYTIEYKDGTLTINGKKQPTEVVNKYQNILKGHKDFTIEKDEDHFNIRNK